MRDAYCEFFKLFPKEDFFHFGLSNVIHIDLQIAKKNWGKLTSAIKNKDAGAKLYIRSMGQKGIGDDTLSRFYREIFKIEIKFDPTNNLRPTKLLEELTNHRKNVTISNYQVSHVFGNTKNVYCFCAPWNIVFIPKLLDPFTGHEAKGEFVAEFQNRFRLKMYQIFEELISEYNQIMEALQPRISNWLKDSDLSSNIVNNIMKEFVLISKPNCD
jgi:hypothetical protein